MPDLEFVVLGASTVDPDTGLPRIQAHNRFGEDPDDFENLGEVDAYSQLGVTALPYPETDGGFCQGFVVRGSPGSRATLIGARDERTAKIVGNMQGGDVVVHTTGPQQAAQLQLKEEKRQASLVTKTSDGKTAIAGLDGKQGTYTVQLGKAMLQVSANGDFKFSNGKASIIVKDDAITLLGKVTAGGDAGLPLLTGTPGPGQVPTVGVVAQ